MISDPTTDLEEANFMPLTDVTVTCAGLQAVTTAPTGYYEIGDVPTGEHSCKAEKVGYETFTFTAEVAADQTTIANPEGGRMGLIPSATGIVEVVTQFSNAEDEDETATGATIMADSIITSALNSGALFLAVGEHTISASLDGYAADIVNVDVIEGETVDARVGLISTALVTYTGQQGRIDPQVATFPLTYEKVLTPELEDAINTALADGSLLGNATISEILESSDSRKLSWKERSACTNPRRVLASLDKEVSVGAWCWASDDQEASESLKESEWVPQGITSSDDATADGMYEGRSVVLVSWYGQNNVVDKGARISFIEYPNVDNDTTYKHVLLATPTITNGKLDIEKVDIHAGGMAWYGNLLYVASTNMGFRIFDMQRIYRVYDEEGVNDVLGRRTPDDGKLYGAEYDYVLLEVGQTKQELGSDDCQVAQTLTEDLCFSSVSLDRLSSPPALITSEYRKEGQMKSSAVGMRIVRWNLNNLTYELEMTQNGLIESDGVVTTPTYMVQGAYWHGNEFYLSTTQTSEGKFYYEKDGDGENPHSMPWPDGGEDLSYWPSYKRLWSVTERPGKRMVFWVYTDEMK